MARVNWNKENIQQLKVYGDLGQLDDFAKLIKCTPNAAKIKYGREFGNRKPTSIYDKKAASIYDRMYPKTHAEAFQVSAVNPFIIEEVPFTGSRSTPEMVIMLAKQMLNIKANKIDSILVPYSVADSKSAANNLFQQAKSYIAKTNKAELAFTIKSTFSGDAEKKYLSGRIWRLK